MHSGIWMYMVIGTRVHTHVVVSRSCHIFTRTQFMHMPNGMGQFSSHELFHVTGQAAALHCVCVFTSAEGQWKGLLQFTEMWRNKERGEERASERGNKLNGVRTKKEKDWEERLREQVYMLCCCSAQFFYFFHDEFIWHERQQSAPCIKH